MTENLPHLLVVDDDARLRDLLRQYLSDNGFLVAVAEDASDARTKLKHFTFDLMILDVMMPGETGLQLAQDLRTSTQIPILMLTAMDGIDDRIAGLESGADDYLVKPFEPRELLLRLNNILKRVPAPAQPQGEIRFGDVVFEPERKSLSRAGHPIRLTDVETALLSALAERSGEILTREELIAKSGTTGGGRAVDVQVTRLRRKIEDDPRTPRFLQTVRGRGYVLRPD